MSAIPHMRMASDVEPNWIPASLAALRSGYSSGHIRRMCLKLAQTGLAHEDKLDNGQKGWVIREDADKKFAEVKRAQQVDAAFCLADLPQKIQNVVLFRTRIVNLIDAKRVEWLRDGKNFNVELDAYCRWLRDNEGIKKLCARSYRNWSARLKAEGQRGLVDNRMEAAPRALINEPFVAEVLRLWLTQNRRSVQLCYDIARDAAEENGWTVVHYKQVATAIFDWSKTNQPEVQRLRFGRKAYEDNSHPFIECDYSTLESNEIWDSDHYQFDVWVQIQPAGQTVDPVTGEIRKTEAKFARPWLTSWQDLRSRKIVGHVVSLAPNQDTIQLAFHRGITTHGVCKEVLIDNGKDYDSYSLQGMTKAERRKLKLSYDAPMIQGLFGSLGVRTVHCQPYHGQGKPIERFHRTLKDRFCKRYETYSGGKPEERPDNCFEKMRGGMAPTLEQFMSEFEGWLENDYHQRVHTGDSMDEAPAVVWENCLVSKIVVNPKSAELLKQRLVKRPVNQNGITWMGQTYASQDLARRVGEELTIRVDHADTNQISVWEPSGEFICFASSKNKVPRNAARTEHLTAAIREVRSDARLQRQMVGVRVRSGQTIAQRAARAAAAAADQAKAARPAADPTTPPPSLRMAHTQLDDQMAEYEKRAEFRMAVGSDLGTRTSRSLEELEGVFGRES